MIIPECITVDFETKAIRNRPHYPPEPVGVSIMWPKSEPAYHAWGHPSANNCDRSHAMFELDEVWRSGLPILFHHGKFDLAVAEERCGFALPPWQRCHDTMFLAFLGDPHAKAIDLKDLAADLLGWEAEERDAIIDWVMDHEEMLPKLPNKKGELVGPSRSRRSKDKLYAAAWISFCPGDVAGPYANGDTRRTAALFAHLWPIIQNNGMGRAYDRERRFQVPMMENERIGLRVDLPRLSRETDGYQVEQEFVETRLRYELKSPGLNFDSDADVAKVLLDRNIVPRENWQLTAGRKDKATGRIIPGSEQLSVKKDNLLPEHFTGGCGDWTGAQIASALGYRNRLKTCLKMFMEPWLQQAADNNGHIATHWNQTRGGDGGTRTGRPSTSDPNLLNISKSFDGKGDGYVHPEFLDLQPLPLVREYVLPDEGGVFLHRDFDGQELRVFGHYECGDLQAQYIADPKLDPHSFVGSELMRVAGREIDRTRVKALNFQGLYGGGVPALERKLRISFAEAKELKRFHNAALPGRTILNDVIKAVVRRGDPIVTWGGRLYYPEEPRLVGGRMQDWIYKLINYLIQGSAADITKESVCQWYEGPRIGRFLVTVYDETNISAPIDQAARAMQWLKDVMEQDWLSIKMLSSPKHGLSWGASKKCKEPCPLCA